MSRENAEIVRQPLELRASSRRRGIERLVLRLPALAALVGRVVFSFPPRSWLRRTMVRTFSRLVFEAANRGDYKAAFALVPKDFETVTPPELVGFGFESTYRGPAGRLRFQEQWLSELGEFQQEAEAVIDLGDHLLLLARMRGIGASSGAAFDSEVAYLIRVAHGRLVTEWPFRSHAEAFEAVGLRGR
jgi:ketosteroid isomerase-like protein